MVKAIQDLDKAIQDQDIKIYNLEQQIEKLITIK